MIQWFCDKYQVDIEKTTSISAPIIPSNTKETIVRHMASYDAAALHGNKYFKTLSCFMIFINFK